MQTEFPRWDTGPTQSQITQLKHALPLRLAYLETNPIELQIWARLVRRRYLYIQRSLTFVYRIPVYGGHGETLQLFVCHFYCDASHYVDLTSFSVTQAELERLKKRFIKLDRLG